MKKVINWLKGIKHQNAREEVHFAQVLSSNAYYKYRKCAEE